MEKRISQDDAVITAVKWYFEDFAGMNVPPEFYLGITVGGLLQRYHADVLEIITKSVVDSMPERYRMMEKGINDTLAEAVNVAIEHARHSGG